MTFSNLKTAALRTCGAATLAVTMLASAGSAEAGWRYRYGGAVAAGLIGGLALGAIAASAATPVYAACFIEPRYFRDAFGRLYVRRIRTCY